jgi:hypothetical protein
MNGNIEEFKYLRQHLIELSRGMGLLLNDVNDKLQTSEFERIYFRQAKGAVKRQFKDLLLLTIEELTKLDFYDFTKLEEEQEKEESAKLSFCQRVKNILRKVLHI